MPVRIYCTAGAAVALNNPDYWAPLAEALVAEFARPDEPGDAASIRSGVIDDLHRLGAELAATCMVTVPDDETAELLERAALAAEMPGPDRSALLNQLRRWRRTRYLTPDTVS